MKAFRRKGERYVARLDEVEREVVSQLAADVALLLGASPAELTEAVGFHGDADPWELPEPGADDVLDRLAQDMAAPGGPTRSDPDAPLGAATPEEPSDPAVRRLLPTASDEPEVAAEFRRFAHVDLRRSKIDRLLALVRALRRADEDDGRLAVPVSRSDVLAGALVDIRLVLAERLDIQDDAAADRLYEEISAAAHDGPEDAVVGGHRGPAAALRLHLGTAYLALTWLQESLATVQLADLDAPDA